MKNDLLLIKLSIRKSYVLLAVAFVVLGTIFAFLDENTYGIISGLYYLLPALLFGTAPMGITASTFAAASPCKKKLQTSTSIRITLIFTVIGYTLYLLVAFIKWKIVDKCNIFDGAIREDVFSSIMLTGFIAGGMMCIMVLSYKKYVISMILTFVILVPVLMLIEFNTFLGIFDFAHPAIFGVLLGLIFIAVGALFSYLLSLLFYKSELSQKATKNFFTVRG